MTHPDDKDAFIEFLQADLAEAAVLVAAGFVEDSVMRDRQSVWLADHPGWEPQHPDPVVV